MLRITWLLRPTGLVVLLAACLEGPAGAQVRLAVDTKSSLAWWQVQPHMGHLWATTCPEDPSWFAGASHSSQYRYNIAMDPMKGRVSSVKEMARAPIPMYPRPSAQAMCTPAVRGEIAVADTARWHDVRGLIVVDVSKLTSGENMRDNFARARVLQTDEFPDVRFTIDSLVGIRKGDTLEATAVGKLLLHGVTRPWSVPVRAWREPLGLRVTGQFAFPAPDLIDVYRLSKYPLGLGVGTEIWKWIHLGIDAVLRPAGSGASSP